MMKDYPIEKFGSKLMVASKSINNIPGHYLQIAQNARIWDGGIGPRKGKQLLTNSVLGTNNKGGFVMNGNLYQIANSKIYQIDLTTGAQTEKATVGYDAMTDILTYAYTIESYVSLGTTTSSYSYGVTNTVGRIMYKEGFGGIQTQKADGTAIDFYAVPYDNSTSPNRRVKVYYSGTTGSTASGTGTDEGDGMVLADGQYITIAGSPITGTINWGDGNKLPSSANKTIIASNNQQLRVFDGTSISTPANAPINSGIIEFCRNYTFLAVSNVLYISMPASPTNSTASYDFYGTGSQQITYDTEILGLKSTMNGLYVFTKDKVHFLGANALQNVAGAATFLSTPLGVGAEPINNLCIAANGDNIFYVSKNLQIQTVNYMESTTGTVIGELSTRPVISIHELMLTIDKTQPSAFAFYNENDKTIQFNLRSVGSPMNDKVIVYDMINDTWGVDTNKFYNYVVKNGYNYYGFSDVNSSVYQDDISNTDAGVPIPFRIRTQNLIIGTLAQKMFGGFTIAGGIGPFTKLDIAVDIDLENIFVDYISGNPDTVPYLGEVGGDVIGDDSIADGLIYSQSLTPFDRQADEGRIFMAGTRITYDITSNSLVQDFILDILATRAEVTNHYDINNKF